ncbi:hypothetical protein I656_03809 [Geobacillus sp. WSUCF1]|nr:hypothetical protein I656_03809 [Geobacillus sp. WSUCF1]
MFFMGKNGTDRASWLTFRAFFSTVNNEQFFYKGK